MQFTVISLSVTGSHIARLHRSGCKDIAKDLSHGVAENITAESGKAAAAKYIAGELDEMGYMVEDVHILSCAR